MHFVVHVVDTTEHVVEQRVKWTASLGKDSRVFWIRFRYLYLSVIDWCDIGRLSEHWIAVAAHYAIFNFRFLCAFSVKPSIDIIGIYSKKIKKRLCNVFTDSFYHLTVTIGMYTMRKSSACEIKTFSKITTVTSPILVII